MRRRTVIKTTHTRPRESSSSSSDHHHHHTRKRRRTGDSSDNDQDTSTPRTRTSNDHNEPTMDERPNVIIDLTDDHESAQYDRMPLVYPFGGYPSSTSDEWDHDMPELDPSSTSDDRFDVDMPVINPFNHLSHLFLLDSFATLLTRRFGGMVGGVGGGGGGGAAEDDVGAAGALSVGHWAA
eukprot:TRINITY_DN6424_c0_g2_i1.p1 TRINITY_DN6424_c0_g2~~TRINITY_DN6424_c0_g2_i1.p1  ORF type:complete len:181 (+),score=23.58 TRINITY_DN6424_c0_g2_i1:133-675(+)